MLDLRFACDDFAGLRVGQQAVVEPVHDAGDVGCQGGFHLAQALRMGRTDVHAHLHLFEFKVIHQMPFYRRRKHVSRPLAFLAAPAAIAKLDRSYGPPVAFAAGEIAGGGVVTVENYSIIEEIPACFPPVQHPIP